jgi:PAS domain S-box-containing protein
MASWPAFNAFGRVAGFGAALVLLAGPLPAHADAPQAAGPAPTPAKRRVFVFQSYHLRDTFAMDTEKGLNEAFSSSGLDVETFAESLDANHTALTPAYLEQISGLLRMKYGSVRFDALVASDDDALSFLRSRRDALFPGVPLVAIGISDLSPSVLDGRSDITGLGDGRDSLAAVMTIVHVRPGTSRIVAITDNTTTGRAERTALEAVLPKLPAGLEVRFLSLGDGTLDDLADKLAALPADNAVYLLHASVDRLGVAYRTEQTTPVLSRRSSVPVFVISDVRVGLGALGGLVTSRLSAGVTAGGMVVSILKGKPVASIQVVRERPARHMFDYAVMRRFGISIGDLPAGSVVINRPPSIIDEYRSEVIGAGIVFVVGSVFLVVLFFEVLRRRRVEGTLRESQTALTAVFNSSPQGIFWKDLDGVFLGCNEVFARAVGLPDARSVRGLTDANLSASAETARMYRADDADVVARNRAKRHIIESFEGPGGARWVDTTKVPLADSQGRVYGVLGVWDDITDRKRAEEEHGKLVEQLQQAVKMEAVGRLAGGMAHDFNNVLTAMIGNLELARAEVHSPTATLSYLDEVQAAANRAASLIRQLLAFSRKQIIEPRVISLNELVSRLRNMLARLIGEDVVLETLLAPDLGSVKVDPGQFEQVLVNLVVNARDAMPEGGRLVVETANVVLDEDYCASHPDSSLGPHVMLAVTDTGQGMAPEVTRRIFEPFFTTKPQGRGTGLGLATAFGSVTQVGGHIDVHSEVGLGTTFRVYLPRVFEQPAAEARAAATAPARGGETVLLVEDDEAVRTLTASMLRRLGYTVLAAPSGPEALKIAGPPGTRIDVLFTDVVMPGMNGRELAEQLAATRPELKVLFASGYTENVIVHHGLVDERLSFIAKPFTMQSLAAKLREVLPSPK